MAAPHVAAYARWFDAEIILLHVEPIAVDPFVWPMQTEHLSELLEHFLVPELEGLKVKRLVRPGDPAREIVSYVTNEKADLIMMPTHGRGPFRRFILGSVTAKVLHDAPCPVWTSAHLDFEDLVPQPHLTDILCAVDLDERGVHTLRYAAGFAQHVRANTLTVAHAVPVTGPVSDGQEEDNDLLAAARMRIAEMQCLAGTTATSCVGSGKIGEFINRAARANNSDLMIIGRGGHGLLGRLRTHDYAIIRESPCPVLSI
jgi:nucleotide-binding universal stress UspA family protein